MKHRLLLWAALMGLLSPALAAAKAHPYVGYIYLSHDEVRVNFEWWIWFWTPDTLWGPVHSDDFIGIKYSPIFFGQVSTCQDDFRYWQPGRPFFQFDPIFNAPSTFHGQRSPHLNADRTFLREDDPRPHRVSLNEEGFAEIYSCRFGQMDDSLVARLDTRRGEI